jgi:OmpA-OmpF porin, OOP family
MRGSFRIAALLLLLCCGPLPGWAEAQNRPRSLNLSTMAGGYLFEGNHRLKDRPIYTLGVGFNFTPSFGVEGVVGLVQTETVASASRDVDLRLARLDLIYHFRPERRLVPYLAGGAGIASQKFQGISDSDEDLQFNYGLGLKYFLSPALALRADVRHIFHRNTGDSNPQRDVYQHLAYTAGLTFQFGGKGPRPQTAAPPSLPVSDQPTPAAAPVKKPVPAASVPKEVKSILLDCPGQPGVRRSDLNDCPPFRLAIEFDSGRSSIEPQHRDELARAAKFILFQMDGQFIIEGHTDSVGPADANRRLSLKRAESVRQYLIDHFNIPAERFTAIGTGQALPIADNSTQEGRLRNRRVEIIFVPQQ